MMSSAPETVMTLAFAVPPCPDSPLRRLDPRWKLAAFLLALVAVALLRDLLSASVALVATLLLAWLGKLPRPWFLARIGLLLLMLSPFVLTLPFLLIDQPWESGIRLALLLTAKALSLMVLALVLLTASPWSDTLKAAHSLWIPGLLIQLVALTYRYAFLVASELARIRIALRVRGYRNRASRHSYRTIGHVAGSLLVRSHERGERVAQAMRCRGYDGQHRSLTDFHTRGIDVVFFLLVSGSATGLVFWDLLQA
jgi:cobalt/nickel transport system permease protein